jgi:hypothetical protein
VLLRAAAAGRGSGMGMDLWYVGNGQHLLLQMLAHLVYTFGGCVLAVFVVLACRPCAQHLSCS